MEGLGRGGPRILVCVEGVDRTGKSELCARLVEACGGEILHFSAPKQDAIAEYLSPLVDYRPGGGRNLFLDRHFLGETIWPSFFGRPSRMRRAEREVIEAVLEHKGALCLLATRDETDLERACVDEPCAGRAAEAQRSFRKETERSILRWREYRHGDDLGEIVSAALALEKAAEPRAWKA